MQYIGKRMIRLYEIGGYDITNGKDRFLMDNDMLMKYLLDDKYAWARISGSYNGIKYKYSELDEKMKKTVRTRKVSKDDFDEQYETFEYNGKQYARVHCNDSESNMFMVYEVLPSVFNDEIFRWIDNKKYQTKEATISLGVFDFYCIYDKNGDAQIDVKYTKCDNRHKNKVTISTIKVNNATNAALIEAIDAWKEEMIKDINTIA